RNLIRIRRKRSHMCRGGFYFFNDWDRYQRHGVLLFGRFDGPHYSLVALNFGDAEQSVPFWFPVGGHYVEELHGGALDLGPIVPPAGGAGEGAAPTREGSGGAGANAGRKRGGSRLSGGRGLPGTGRRRPSRRAGRSRPRDSRDPAKSPRPGLIQSPNRRIHAR